jgi:hypothetical protein
MLKAGLVGASVVVLIVLRHDQLGYMVMITEIFFLLPTSLPISRAVSMTSASSTVNEQFSIFVNWKQAGLSTHGCCAIWAE